MNSNHKELNVFDGLGRKEKNTEIGAALSSIGTVQTLHKKMYDRGISFCLTNFIRNVNYQQFYVCSRYANSYINSLQTIYFS